MRVYVSRSLCKGLSWWEYLPGPEGGVRGIQGDWRVQHGRSDHDFVNFDSVAVMIIADDLSWSVRMCPQRLREYDFKYFMPGVWECWWGWVSPGGLGTVWHIPHLLSETWGQFLRCHLSTINVIRLLTSQTIENVPLAGPSMDLKWVSGQEAGWAGKEVTSPSSSLPGVQAGGLTGLKYCCYVGGLGTGFLWKLFRNFQIDGGSGQEKGS